MSKEQSKWKVHIEHLPVGQKQYHLEYDDHHIAYLTKKQYESFKELQGAGQQPIAGEFTKEVRTVLGNPQGIPARLKTITDYLFEACDRLDSAEAINKDLLDACNYTEILLSKGIGQNTHALALIAKAKKKG